MVLGLYFSRKSLDFVAGLNKVSRLVWQGARLDDIRVNCPLVFTVQTLNLLFLIRLSKL